MKKSFLFLLIIGFVTLLGGGACNSPSDDPTTQGGGGKDTEWTVDYLLKFPDEGDEYPGGEIDLTGRDLVDISNYQSITVNATLYTDKEGNSKATTPTGEKKNLVQFKLLKATGDWDTDSNLCGMYKGEEKENTKYNMNVDGDTTWTFPDGASGVPAKLLLQANWKDFTTDGVKVKSIKVNNITFTAKTGAPVLDEVYDNGDFITIAGNKITFNNAMFSDAAAIYKDTTWTKEYLTGKKLVISFTIEDHASHLVPVAENNNTDTTTATEAEHQIHIQAANHNKVKFNGRNTQPGQKYITLDSTKETGWNDTSKSGTIKVALNDLISAAEVSADANDCKGPFDLDAIRIVNNGTMWTDTDKSPPEKHTRCKSYTLVINSVKVE